MNITHLACAASIFATMGASAGAATIAQFISGTISGPHTVDTAGLFSPPGTDLAGTAYKLHFQYGTIHLNPNGCGTTPSNCSAVSKGSANGTEALENANIPASVLISVEVNGINRSFAPFVLGNVVFRNLSANQSALDVFVDMSTGNYTSSAGVSLSYTSPVVFGAELSPTNNPVASDGANLQLCVVPLTGSTTPSCDTLTLSISKVLQ